MQSSVLRINGVRVDRDVLVRVLDLLDHSASPGQSEKRVGRRFRYRVPNALVYPDSTDKNIVFVVPTRNLSAEGMAFLHSHMMHTGRSCTVQLPSQTGTCVSVNATVVRCRHVRAMLHEIAVKFDSPVDLSTICHASPA
jgi:hypothetical protein